jgi:hypothetical protein
MWSGISCYVLVLASIFCFPNMVLSLGCLFLAMVLNHVGGRKACTQSN